MSWTPERVSVLEKMWSDGKSAAEIAKELGEGVTRNAVIGKAHRMGLSGRPSPIKKPAKGTAKKTAKPAAKTPKEKIKPAAAKAPASKPLGKKIKPIPAAPLKKKKEMPTGEGLSILDLTDRICKWPFGDPQDADFHFCGAASRPTKPYCPEHCEEAYQILQRKKVKRKTKLKLAPNKPNTQGDDASDDDEEDLDDIENLDVDALENSDDIDDDDGDITAA